MKKDPVFIDLRGKIFNGKKYILYENFQKLIDEMGNKSDLLNAGKNLQEENETLKNKIISLEEYIKELPDKLRNIDNPIFQMGQKFANQCYMETEKIKKEIDFYREKIKEMQEYKND